MPDTDADTTSHITLPVHNQPVDYGDDGPPLGATGYDGVQSSLSARSTEVAAIEAIEHPHNPARMDDDEYAEDMLKQGYVKCARCRAFKLAQDFSRDERNAGRLGCHSYCLECMAVMKHRKRQAVHPVQAGVRYEYRQLRAKRGKHNVT